MILSWEWYDQSMKQNPCNTCSLLSYGCGLNGYLNLVFLLQNERPKCVSGPRHTLKWYYFEFEMILFSIWNDIILNNSRSIIRPVDWCWYYIRSRHLVSFDNFIIRNKSINMSCRLMWFNVRSESKRHLWTAYFICYVRSRPFRQKPNYRHPVGWCDLGEVQYKQER